MQDKIPDSWCPLPWGHIATTSNGSLRVCCQSNTSKSKGLIADSNGNSKTLANTTLVEVQNSAILKNLRLKMLNGEWGDECVRCQREFNANSRSRNIYERTVEWSKDITFNKAKELTQADGTINYSDFPTVFLDLRFGNKCNLKCVMCSPTDSNRWYDDYVAIWNDTTCSGGGSKVSLIKNNKGKYINSDDSMNWFSNQESWNNLDTNLQYITRIYVAGGEPTLIDEHFDFLQKCVNNGYAKNICVEYNSNISMIPDRAWGIWDEFKQIIIGCSIDGIGEINDLIRFPSKWSKIEANLNRMYNAPANFIFHLTSSIQILNIWHLPEFIDYMFQSSNKVHPLWANSPLKISAHPVHNPPFLNICILPDSFKKRIKFKFTEYIKTLQTTNFDLIYGKSMTVDWVDKVKDATKILTTYIKFMDEQIYTSEELALYKKNFIHYMDTLDTLRGTNWATTCHEVYQATLEWR